MSRLCEEYNLTFLEAMVALSKGKEVKNEWHPWIYLNCDGVIAVRYMGDTIRRYWFDKDEVSSKWREVA